MADHPIVGGGDTEYSENYDKIFRKSLKVRLIDKWNRFLIKLFLEKRKV